MINLTKPSRLLLYLLLILTFFIILFFLDEDGLFGTYGFNKTIGLAWDFCSGKLLLAVAAVFISIVIYFILWLVRARLAKAVSAVHLIVLFVVSILVISERGFGCTFTMLAVLLSVILAIINLGFAIGYKISDK